MSRSVGGTLPASLLARLAAPGPDDRLDHAVVLLTVDPEGWSHPALVSYGELVATHADRLRVGLLGGSRSSRYLAVTRRATLVFADADLLLYVKAEAAPLPAADDQPGLVRFELLVRDVLEDRAHDQEGGARLVTGLTVVWSAAPEVVSARARTVRACLAR